MDAGRRGSEDFSSAVIWAAAVVAPVLALALVALLIATGGDDDGTVSAPPRPAAEAEAPGAAFADETAAAGSRSSSGNAAEAVPEPEADPQLPPEPEARPVPPVEPSSEPEPPTGSPSSDSPFGSEPSIAVTVRRGQSVELLDAPGGELVAEQGDETEFGSPSVFWVRRHTPRWLGVSTPVLPNGEIAWIRADRRRLTAGLVEHSIQVDLSTRTAELFQKGREIRSWPVTVGAPGTETPVGRFAITDTFEGDLNPAYGCCAFALSATQPDLPSGWMGGNRIAFHGTSGPVGLAVSSGCIRSADHDLRVLLPIVPLGTPVAIRQ